MMKESNLEESLRKYFDETPKEQLEADWKNIKHWNEIGPTVDEWLQSVNRTETYNEKVEHLKQFSGKSYKECSRFVSFVMEYLDACGYFIGDFDCHPQVDNVKYSNKDFGTLLMDMALQYNMEQGVEYKCTLIDNKYK